MQPPRKKTWDAVVATVLAASILGFAHAAAAFFDAGTSSSGAAVTSKRIFPTSRTLSPADFRDASSGVEANASDPFVAAGDGRTRQTSAWSILGYSQSRYLDFDFAGSLPGGVPMSSTTFNFSYASANNNTTCFYFEVRARSTDTVIATHGGTGSNLSCNGSSGGTTSTSLPEITSSDTANDLRIRVYENNLAGLPSVTDWATVTGSTGYAPFTLNPVSSTDASSGIPTTTAWSLATAGDGAVYVDQNNWKGGFDATRYYKFSYPASVPTNAVVTGATFTHTYKDQDGISVCNYIEVYAGSTLLASHGSTTSPYCNLTGSFVTNAITLPEVTTPAMANSIVVKMYVWDGSASKRSSDDLASLTLNYYLN